MRAKEKVKGSFHCYCRKMQMFLYRTK